MQIITDPQALQTACLGFRRAGLSIALVPTMGALHAGHLSLLSLGRQLADKVVLSLFVNPTQFGPTEDFQQYPRDFSHDCDLARTNGADVLFAPEPSAMYAPDHAAWVEVPELAQTLCGASRPGHFRGVCTVVLKLFNLAQPTVAVFGEKDRQQLCIIKKMASDLNFPLEVRGAPTVREPDGLALSSRNKYLSAEERAQAVHIIRGLRLAEELFKTGEDAAAELAAAVRDYWRAQMPDAAIDYLQFTHPENMRCLEHLENPCIIAAAVKFSKTRLIDNLELKR